MTNEATANQLEHSPNFGARMMYLLERRKQKMLRAVEGWSPLGSLMLPRPPIGRC